MSDVKKCMTEEKKESLPDNKDYDKFAYFVSRAINYSVIFRPKVQELLATGEWRTAKDDDGNLMEGYRIEFHNGKLAYEKNELNKSLIEFLRLKIFAERDLPEKRKVIKEETKPIKKIPEDEVQKMLAEQEAELKEKYNIKDEPVEEGKKEDKEGEKKKENVPF